MTNFKEEFDQIVTKQKDFFRTNATLDIHFRLMQLDKLYASILKHENDIYDALWKDLRKSKIEVYEGEIYPGLKEISYTKKHLKKWAKSRKVQGPQFAPLSRGYVQQEPRGVALIFSPYNHPFSTSFVPMVSAIAAGNCVILKPSELVEHSALVIQSIVSDVFPPEYVTVVSGGREAAEALLDLSVDTIFFTGSTAVGKTVMQAAAKRIIPVTLQLGGKCPGIVDKNASLKNAAARIVWGKFWNAGQACNTIDYLLVHADIHDELIGYLKEYIVKYFGNDPKQSAHFGRILNEKHFDRISRYLGDGHIVAGGHTDKSERYISPTIMDHIVEHSPILNEEIFGPLLPIISYNTIEEAIAKINAKPKALAVYIFSKDTKIQNKIIKETDSGSVCVNDLMIQSQSPEMPMGGIGESGFGRFHGKTGFEMFSQQRSVLKQVSFDFPLRFPPHNEKFLLPLLRRFLR